MVTGVYARSLMWSLAVWCQASAICARFLAQLRPCGPRLSLILIMVVRRFLPADDTHHLTCSTSQSVPEPASI